MRLHVVLGLSSRKADSAVSTVYVGHNGTEAKQAMEASASPFFFILPNPAGLTKHNSRAAINAAKVVAAQAALDARAEDLAKREAAIAEREAKLSSKK